MRQHGARPAGPPARPRARAGAAPGASAGAPIVEHADVRRMLLTMKASIEALRALHYFDARQIDLGHHLPDPAERAAAAELAGLRTPLSKGWGTDLASEITSLAIQVFGGMGYVEETGLAQLYRDARITAIYEGPTASRPWTSSAASCRCEGGVWSPTSWRRCGPPPGSCRVPARPGPDRRPPGRRARRAAAGHRVDPGQRRHRPWAGAGRRHAPHLRMCSQVVGGWLLGIEALAAPGRRPPASRRRSGGPRPASSPTTSSPPAVQRPPPDDHRRQGRPLRPVGRPARDRRYRSGGGRRQAGACSRQAGRVGAARRLPA